MLASCHRQSLIPGENTLPTNFSFSAKEKRSIEKVIRFKDLPYNPFRKTFYTVKELMRGYPGKTLDQRIADHYNAHNKNIPDVHEALAQRIHDHAIDESLKKFVTPTKGLSKRVVGVMGGHSVQRTAPSYAAMVQIGWQLARKGFVIVTGGGPGIMEAANLGAYMAASEASELNQSLDALKKFPDYKSDPHNYVKVAMAVRTSCKDSGLSLAIPTWAYSDEPTGQFSSAIGKYFSNSIREDGLLAIAAWGVSFAPGSSGTLQEVFQDIAHNSYWTFGSRGPMVFYSSFYTDKPSIFDVVKWRADKDDYGDMVGVCSTIDEVVEFVLTHPMRPQSAASPKRTFGNSNMLLHL
jgi:predicted Rossmann-fold nucleotide-binding protein